MSRSTSNASVSIVTLTVPSMAFSIGTTPEVELALVDGEEHVGHRPERAPARPAARSASRCRACSVNVPAGPRKPIRAERGGGRTGGGVHPGHAMRDAAGELDAAVAPSCDEPPITRRRDRTQCMARTSRRCGSGSPTSTSCGRGCWVTTADGERYLDFTARHRGHLAPATAIPKVVAAIARAGRPVHPRPGQLLPPRPPRTARRPASPSITPDGIDTFFFANSGAEATEARGEARQAGDRPAERDRVPGSASTAAPTSTMAMTTSKTGYRAGHAPLPVRRVRRAVPPRRSAPVSSPRRRLGQLRSTAFRHLLASQTAPGETAAVILEPVLGRGRLRAGAGARSSAASVEICAEHGILFVADEVQSGFGRTGTMLRGRARPGVTPDIIVMAKGIASGFPHLGDRCVRRAHAALAGRLARRDLRRQPDRVRGGARHHRGAHRPRLPRQGERPRRRQLRDGLTKLAAEHPVIADVRGPGLMVAVGVQGPRHGRAGPGSHRGGHRPRPRLGPSAADERRYLGQHHPVHAAARGRRGRGVDRAHGSDRRPRRHRLTRGSGPVTPAAHQGRECHGSPTPQES